MKEFVASGKVDRGLIDRDLKAFLLKLKKTLEEEDIQPIKERMSSIVERLLKGIEGYQLQSRITNSLCIPLPPLWEDVRGELIFKKPARRPAGRPFYCFLTLDLGGIGTLVVWILMEERGLQIKFISDNKDFADHLSRSLHQLRSGLATIGLRLQSLDAEYSRGMKGFYEGFDVEV